MKITIYTVADCQFSKQEKEYLTTHQLQYEEKNLETNKEFLTEMLAVSNNFAGTPVTKIEKDDGQISILKGFTQVEFDTALGLSTPVQKTETVEAQSVVTPPIPVTPALFPSMPTPAPVASPTPITPLSAEASAKVDEPIKTESQPVADPQLNSILNNLQTQANLNPMPSQNTPTETVVPPTPTTPTAPAPTIPNVPDFQDK